MAVDHTNMTLKRRWHNIQEWEHHTTDSAATVIGATYFDPWKSFLFLGDSIEVTLLDFHDPTERTIVGTLTLQVTTIS